MGKGYLSLKLNAQWGHSWSDFVGGNHRKDNFTHFRRQGTSVIWGRGIAMVSVPSSHGTNTYSPFFEALLCRINCLRERKGPCCSANLPHDLKPANTTRRYSSPDRIKRRPVKQLTMLRHPTMDLLLNKARVSGDWFALTPPDFTRSPTVCPGDSSKSRRRPSREQQSSTRYGCYWGDPALPAQTHRPDRSTFYSRKVMGS